MFCVQSFVFVFLAKSIRIKVYKNTRFILVLCRGKAWSTILQDEHRIKLLKNRGVRKTFGPKRYEVL
jgi:hypothetical protein